MLPNFHSHRRWSATHSTRDGLCIIGTHVFSRFGDDFFQRVPCGSSRADGNDPHQRVALVALVLHGSAHG